MNQVDQKSAVAAMFGIAPEHLDRVIPDWAIFAKANDATELDKWLQDFLDSASSLREAYDKGTAHFTKDEHGNIRGHFTPEYYLDLMESMVGKDLRDPWNTSAKPVSVEDIFPGYNSKAKGDDLGNRKIAITMALSHEDRLAKTPVATTSERELNSRISIPKFAP